MKPSRDRVKKGPGHRGSGKRGPQTISDGELARRVAEFCRLMRQRNTELSAQLRQQQQVLLAKLRRGPIQ